MPKPYNRKFLAYTIILICITLPWACHEANQSKKIEKIAQKDSITGWLGQFKFDNTSLPKKASLLKKATKATEVLSNDSLKAKYFTELSAHYLSLRDSINFRKVNKAAVILTQKIHDSANLASSYKSLGSFLFQHNIQDSAYYSYRKAKLLFEAINDQYNLSLVLHDIGRVQALIGDNIRAESTLLRAISKLKSLHKHKELARCYSELADNAKLLDQPEKALEDYTEALIYLKKANAPPIKILQTKHNMALVHQKQGLHKKAIAVFLEVLGFDSLRQKEPRAYSRVLNNLGFSYLKSGQLTYLPDPFMLALKLQDSLNDISGKASSTSKLGQYYLAINDSVKALANLKIAKKLATKTKSAKNKLSILKMLARVDHKNTVTHFNNFAALNDSIKNEERQIREKFGRIQFETDEAIAQSAVLAREKQLWIGIAASVLLLGFSGFIINMLRVRNKNLKFRQAQQASNQEIFNLMLAQGEKIEEGKKMEQKRISEELHDGVLGKMLGARMILLGLNKKSDTEAIAERAKAISILQGVEGEVRAISHELSYAAYQKIHNFILSIKKLIETIQIGSKINITFDFTNELDWDSISGEIKINLYRMVQESLQNSVKHAACEKITMSFHADERLLTVTIADDGQGFVQKKGKKGIGMRNLESRSKKVNGNWYIESKVGEGTTVTFKIPLVSNQAKIIESSKLKPRFTHVK